MAIDFQQIVRKIREIGKGAQAHQKILEKQREDAFGLLKAHANDLDLIKMKVKRVVEASDPNLRCALPANEQMDSHIQVPGVPTAATLIAIDGSQIVPDRHAGMVYGLVNIGTIIMRIGSGEAPHVFTTSDLLYEDELRSNEGAFLNEGGIALRRDAAERARLLELADRYPPPVVALTDGPVELWGAKDPENSSSYRRYLQKYLQDLKKLEKLNITLAGYVDKPAAELVVRLLEVTIAAEDDLKNIREYHRLRGVSDRWLFGNLLQPGERSAIFALQSSSTRSYKGQSAIHFFYLNVGSHRRAAISRIEIPQWVAEDTDKLNLLHETLIQQNRLLGAKPYPYILQRAHETAKVSNDDREQVELMLSLELRNQGLDIEGVSGKQSIKEYSENKKRYGR